MPRARRLMSPVAMSSLLLLGIFPASLSLADGEGEGEGEGPGLCPGSDESCCVSHESAGCNDTECCEVVCNVDPFCCEVEWDQICADEACFDLCSPWGCDLCGEGHCDEWLCDGDANGDGIVDPLDSGYILSRFGLDPCVEGCSSDVNCDSLIDPLDSGYALARLGTCDQPVICETTCD